MFCFQCQETVGNTGCTKAGVCGKKDDTSNAQDNLIFAVKGIAYWLEAGREKGVVDKDAEVFVMEALFTTVTNVNFDTKRITEMVGEAFDVRDRVRTIAEKAGVSAEGAPKAAVATKEAKAGLIDGAGVIATENEDVRSLRELITYGVKGMAAYLDHAYVLGYEEAGVMAFITKALAKLTDDSLTGDDLVALALETGEKAVATMALLDKANTETYGTQEVTSVSTAMKKGKSILISGHDLKDLDELLIQTEGKGINVYTHGEMLVANAYPNLKKYPHLVGNYGGAWWAQQEEFEKFPGAILMTTNCLQKPRDSYADRIFTTGLVGFDGMKHIADRADGKAKDFSSLIDMALSLADAEESEGASLTIGFAKDSVLGVADKVVEAVKAGDIKRFVVMAGCDGRHKSREYFTDVAKNLPEDTVILTAGCAKYRYNQLNLGDIGGIPRVLDAGQCNDSYSLAVIALKLAEVFGAESVNDLPLSFDIGWYEQKAVTVLLALLHLGVKGIRLGPTLPAFLSENVANTLVEAFGIKPTTEATADVAAIMAGK